MKVDGQHFRSIWLEEDGWSVGAIDQRRLPHEFVVARLTTCEEAAEAIRGMLVRGAPLIGATAAFGMALAMRQDGSDAALERACQTLVATRPTAINLKWAVERMRAALQPLAPSARCDAAYARADEITEEDSGNRQKWPRFDREDRRRQAARRAGECADPLQCRLARDRGLGHGDRANLSRA
jgi:methylthioribose-1-phosphate isomerase